MERRHHKNHRTKILWYIAGIIVIAVAGSIFAFSNPSQVEYVKESKPIATSTIGVKALPQDQMRIVSYPEKLEQGDPAIIVVEGLTTTKNIKSFTLGDRPFYFFLYKGYVTAFFAAKLDEPTGNLPLTLTFKDGKQIKGNLVIDPRKVVKGAFNIPEKLGGNTRESINTLIRTLAGEGKVINSLPSTKEVLWTEDFRAPLDSMVIDDPFGYTRVISNFTMPHKGTDYEADIGTKVFAMNKGVVRLTTEFRNYGNTIIIDHGSGVQTVYMHLSKIDVKEGQSVEKGQLIGLTGDSGYADHPHLHLSIRIWEISIDPEKFLKIFRENKQN